MSMRTFQRLVIFLAAIYVATSQNDTPQPIHHLRPSAGSRAAGVSCRSWRFGIETNNIIGWPTVPKECEHYVGDYMLGGQYRQDSAAVTAAALTYVRGLNRSNDGKDVWVFDIDETSLSNLPYYAQHGFGVEPLNVTAYSAWFFEGKAPALAERLKLYKKLVRIGIKIVFLTGRPEFLRNLTMTNLHNQGYTTWEKLILKNGSYPNTIVYKSGERAKLEEDGYRIVGNIGDQWSDLLGAPMGNRTFKVPNPMYYVS